MKKRRLSSRTAFRYKSRFISTLVALVITLSVYSCAKLPENSDLVSGLGSLGKAIKELGGSELVSEKVVTKNQSSNGLVASNFSDCPQFFASKKPPLVVQNKLHRALCYDAFAILHSGESKTAVYVAQKLNRVLVADADEKRTDRFFADARLRSAERANLEDYRKSKYDRGHLAPAGQMPTAQAMAQSFSLANVVPQAPHHNQVIWKISVEEATKKYAGRAVGDVYVITGPVFEPSIVKSKGIGPGQVRVPKYLFKLVYDENENRARVHWHLNADSTRASKPITYGELVKRTGIEFLPGISLNQ